MDQHLLIWVILNMGQPGLKWVIIWLVVSNMAFIFHHIWDVILPIDELIFSRWLKPPTSYGLI